MRLAGSRPWCAIRRNSVLAALGSRERAGPSFWEIIVRIFLFRQCSVTNIPDEAFSPVSNEPDRVCRFHARPGLRINRRVLETAY